MSTPYVRALAAFTVLITGTPFDGGEITPQMLAYFNISTGFKSGDFNGSFLSTVPEEIQLQLVPVRPEKVKAYETGILTSS